MIELIYKKNYKYQFSLILLDCFNNERFSPSSSSRLHFNWDKRPLICANDNLFS